MNKRFLDKVLGQIVSETRIDYDWEVIETPFPHIQSFFYPTLLNTPSSFLKHCVEVYGLNEQETKYVWEEYKRIILDMIKNNG